MSTFASELVAQIDTFISDPLDRNLTRHTFSAILAVDPGLAGAFALLIGDTMTVDDLPLHQAQHGRGAKVRPELDVHGLRV